jgi:hypothetical protein
MTLANLSVGKLKWVYSQVQSTTVFDVRVDQNEGLDG